MIESISASVELPPMSQVDDAMQERLAPAKDLRLCLHSGRSGVGAELEWVYTFRWWVYTFRWSGSIHFAGGSIHHAGLGLYIELKWEQSLISKAFLKL